ncbi:MAG: permease-like cell division protein FtsX [Candidatus Pacebacteria bacterium]|nr:permease-like cell division protein FtsX [Candidatus Paceibacterota bacterium]
MFTSLKRTIRIGIKSFARNIGINIATIFIITLVILLFSLLFIFNSASKILIAGIQEKVDVSIYFNEDALTENIMEIKSVVSQIPEVKNVEYVSKEEALDKFIERHKEEPILIESITEIGDNPFLASLNIRVLEASQYSQVTSLLENGSFKNLINKIDYYQRKPVIDRIFSIISAVNRGGFATALVLCLVSVFIAFNTVRIAISNMGEEISVMRLVGASDKFIKAPFLIQGAVCGIISALIAFILIFSFSYAITSKVKVLAPDVSVLGLFISNVLFIFLLQIAVGVSLGIFSSLIAVRKYLKI